MVDKEKWLEMYKIAKKLKNTQHLDIFNNKYVVFNFDDKQQPIVARIGISKGTLVGVSIFPTIKSQLFLKDMHHGTSKVVDAFSYDLASVECLMVYFGNRYEVSKVSYQVMKQLGVSFRGDGNWIIAESNQIGFDGKVPTSKEIEVMQQVMRGYLNLSKKIEQGIFNFNSSLHSKKWLHTKMNLATGKSFESLENFQYPKASVVKMPTPLSDLEKYELNKISNHPKINHELEITYFYTSTSENGQYFPMLAVAERHSSLIVAMEMFNDVEVVIGNLKCLLYNYVVDFGKPKKIYLRLEVLKEALWALCHELNIKIEMTNNLPTLEIALIEIGDYLLDSEELPEAFDDDTDSDYWF
ncbi:DUF7309 domain-containing protein [Vagococcus zengguangii]|uniref:Uncharacterized protein n=1 Tax=Vagococcus zengguangii TaxID=2571750 RepID=A0A4D7CSI9_9ENTE|nr:hypothetical protein [Vagococcus zengguangii]QCI85642.1 hypothetical protein FA707_01060 [Vagococcus zengguangii]TLG81582.1 hypothetical protein FE258_00040 [Vagococcus zengguangii]